MMRISDGSSDLCSADLPVPSLAALHLHELGAFAAHALHKLLKIDERLFGSRKVNGRKVRHHLFAHRAPAAGQALQIIVVDDERLPNGGFLHVQLDDRSEASRVGKECDSTCRYGWSRSH